jgi:hypothetical protein
MSTDQRKNVLFIGLGILAVGIVLLGVGIQRSPAFLQGFQCAYDLGMNNSSLTQDQIIEYCNNQILKAENVDEDLITIGFGIIIIVIGLVVTGTGGIWLIVRRTRERTEEASLSDVSIEKMMNNREQQEDDNWFTPKKVLFYCIIVGLVSGTLSIFIDWLVLLSMVAFVFASITIWYMFGEKLHKWKERRRSRNVFTRQ